MSRLRMLLMLSLVSMVFASPCPRSSWCAEASGEGGAAELRRKVEYLEKAVERLRGRLLELEKRVDAERAEADAEPAKADAAEGLAAKHINRIGMEFALIPAGEFQMGCTSAAEACEDDEKPRHVVRISKPFYLNTTEVTQAQWETVMGPERNRSRFKGADHPVENVSWNDAQEFIRKLNEREGHHRYRLPTEADWEYAARAGSGTIYSFGDDAGRLDDHAWYDANSKAETHPVARKSANAWGLHDMHGNVWEWVQDWNGPYSAEAATDPRGPETGEYRGLRGGGRRYSAGYCRSANRNFRGQGFRIEHVGFRLALSPGH